MIPRLEGGVLNLQSDPGTIRQDDRAQGLDDDAFAEVVFDGREAEFTGDGGREDVRIGQTVV